jgi:hypothetical protein
MKGPKIIHSDSHLKNLECIYNYSIYQGFKNNSPAFRNDLQISEDIIHPHIKFNNSNTEAHARSV